MSSFHISNWETALDFLDDYAFSRKEELDQRGLGKGYGLIKSYMIETSSNDHNVKDEMLLSRTFERANWRFHSIGDNGYYEVSADGQPVGFAESISERYVIVHSMRKTDELDRHVRNSVKDSPQLDFVWLSGSYLDILWQLFIREQMPDRYVAFKFEHQSWFEDTTWAEDDDDENSVNLESEDDILTERRGSKLTVSARVRKIRSFLPELQNVLSDFKAIKMLRIPAPDIPGGYDFWDWGKITYRAANFRYGRGYLLDVLDLYQQVTELIEKKAWFQVEEVRLPQDETLTTFSGTPITFKFPDPLDTATFHNFIETTFEHGHGPFRLWGNPLWLGNGQKVHIYGIDLHLWQKIYLELTPSRFIVILPKGTCGNTIHRLVSNIQRYVSPDVQTYVGESRYEELVREIIVGRVTN